MKKEITAISTILGMMASTVMADDVISYQHGKVSDSRYLLASADGMTCGKEIKEKVKECRAKMKEAKCGSDMKECKTILKGKEMSCGAGNMKKTKDKAKEMACGQCGAKK